MVKCRQIAMQNVIALHGVKVTDEALAQQRRDVEAVEPLVSV